MKNSAAVHDKKLWDGSRIITILLGFNIFLLRNFESELFQTLVVCFGFKRKASCALIGICHGNAGAP